METEFEKGTFTPETLLWHPDEIDWLPLSDCHPSWTQPNFGAILRPGPLQIPLSTQTAQQPLHPPPLPETSLFPQRAALKPVAHSEAPSLPSSNDSFLKRLLSRKS